MFGRSAIGFLVITDLVLAFLCLSDAEASITQTREHSFDMVNELLQVPADLSIPVDISGDLTSTISITGPDGYTWTEVVSGLGASSHSLMLGSAGTYTVNEYYELVITGAPTGLIGSLIEPITETYLSSAIPWTFNALTDGATGTFEIDSFFGNLTVSEHSDNISVSISGMSATITTMMDINIGDTITATTSGQLIVNTEMILSGGSIDGNGSGTEPGGLVAYWNFDEGQGTIAHDAVGNNDGTINGTPRWTNGYFGGGLEFDGTANYVDCGADVSLDITNELTIAAWIKADTFENWDGIATKGVNSLSFAMQIWGDGTLRLGANWGTLAGAIGFGFFNSYTKMPEGEWVHAAVTYDDMTIRFYINGISNILDMWELDNAIAFGTNTESLILGCDFPGGDEYFDGVMDELRIYSRALTEAEINQIMGGEGTTTVKPGEPSDLDDLVLHLTFDEGSGNTAADSSGYGNHGQLMGNVDWVTGVNGSAVYIRDDSADNMVLVQDDSSLDITDEITMAAWVYVENMIDSWGAVVTKADSYMLHTDKFSVPYVRMDPIVFLGNDTGIWPSQAGATMPFGEWHHVVGIYDGQEKHTYIDGVKMGSYGRVGQIHVTDSDLAIGRDNRSCCSSRRASLMVDDLMIFSRAVTEAEIQQIMSGSAPSGNTTPPIITAGPTATSVTATSAVITWSTNEASSSLVEYAAPPDYDNLVATGADNTTSHSVTLTGLSPDTTYNYAVLSIDSSGNRVKSDGQSFTTSPASTSGGYVLVGTDPDDSIVPNINQVFVYSDGENISFRITTHSPWDRYVDFYIDIDWDQNPYTGFPDDGTDCSIGMSMEDGEYNAGFWVYDSSVGNYVSRKATLFDVWLYPNENRYEVSISLSELGNPDAIDFLVWMVVVDVADFAPKNGLYSYTIPSSSQTADRTLSITSAEGSPGSTATVKINISDATGVAGGDIVIKYDSSVLIPGDVTSTSLSSGISLVVNDRVPGEIRIGMAGTQSIAYGSGALLNIVFMVSSSAQTGSQTLLQLDSADMYQASGTVIPVKLQNGTVTIAQPGIRGDVDGDGVVRSNDARLALQIATGLIIPTEYQSWAADINGDGHTRSNDAILILSKAAGLSAPRKHIIAKSGGQITAMLAEGCGVAGEIIALPLQFDNTAELAGGDICITYDSDVLRAVDVLPESGVLLASNITERGRIRLGFANSSEFSSKTIASIRFEILADDISPLSFASINLYNRYATRLSSRGADGEFRSWAIPPEHNALLQNFPNPLNPDTWIPYQLREDSDVTIRIYSVAGDLVRELDLGFIAAGVYITTDRAAHWDGRNASGKRVASGVYFYSIQAGDYTATKKMILAK